jgi:hypothetical protein
MSSTTNYQESPAHSIGKESRISDCPEPSPVAEQQKEHCDASHSTTCNPPEEHDEDADHDADVGQRGRSKCRTFVHPAQRYHQTLVRSGTEAERLLKIRYAVSASAQRYRSASRSQSVDRSQHRRGT